MQKFANLGNQQFPVASPAEVATDAVAYRVEHDNSLTKLDGLTDRGAEVATGEPRKADESNHTHAVYVLCEKEGLWIAHALQYDLVATDPDKEESVRKLRTLLTAQIGFGRTRGHSNCFFPAPARYWQPPFEYMALPTEAEISAMKFESVGSGEQPYNHTEWQLQHNLLNTLKDVSEGQCTPRFALEIITQDFGHRHLPIFGQDGADHD